ncbi:hypothetical protein QRX50_10065 [Amycolatopsis carbonis]|uniref:Uncharacterized protein n=1 Tax=Amycolatopsis carbonis TaxID=715471 RepID=A0A9Y2IKZ5_9PSEU|nr:hypothetical protein [Amycolatopsis sp. 2-15]WIX81075.1 hypothetical protein QRX50_10065 [Amycolatopsis sp. 2-15]
MTPTHIVGLAGVQGERTGIASATVNAARQTGTALGVAALGALLVVTVLTATTLRGA